MIIRYFIFTGILAVLLMGEGIVQAGDSRGSATSPPAVEPEPGADGDHDEHGEEDAEHARHEGHGTGTHLKKEVDGDHGSHEETPGHRNHDAHGHEAEARVIEMTKAQQEEIGLVLASAQPGHIDSLLSLVGEIRLHEDRLAHLVPKVAGIVREVRVSLGDRVREGQVLAIIDSYDLVQLKADYLEKSRAVQVTRRAFERKDYLKKENIASEADWLSSQAAFQNAETALNSARRRLAVVGLSNAVINNLHNEKDVSFGQYALRSPIDGAIITKHITRGEKVGDEEVFAVADLSSLWVDLQIPSKDLGSVKEKMPVEIVSAGGLHSSGKIALVGPVVNEATRTVLARMVLPNPKGLWKPGMFVNGRILKTDPAASVVIEADAVQHIEGKDVVFTPEKKGFKAVEVTLGRRNRNRVEILKGLEPGERYASKGAFELKAVIVTSGAGAHAGHGH